MGQTGLVVSEPFVVPGGEVGSGGGEEGMEVGGEDVGDFGVERGGEVGEGVLEADELVVGGWGGGRDGEGGEDAAEGEQVFLWRGVCVSTMLVWINRERSREFTYSCE